MSEIIRAADQLEVGTPYVLTMTEPNAEWHAGRFVGWQFFDDRSQPLPLVTDRAELPNDWDSKYPDLVFEHGRMGDCYMLEATAEQAPVVDRRTKLYQHIDAELVWAYSKHGRESWGRHEFYGILKEEVDELWDSIKADEPLTKVALEALQVAAMVIRYLETGDRYQGDIPL